MFIILSCSNKVDVTHKIKIFIFSFDEINLEDTFLTEGMAFTASISSVRKELTEIKNQCSMNYTSTDLNIFSEPIFPLSDETNSVPFRYENQNVANYGLSNLNHQQNILPQNNLFNSYGSRSISDCDDTSDIFEDPMSSSEFVRFFFFSPEFIML